MRSPPALALAVATVVAATVVYFMATGDVRGFEDYLKRIAGENGIEIGKVFCAMNGAHGRSRMGWCWFQADAALFEKLKTSLKLQESRKKAHEYVSSPAYREGCYAQEWVLNPAYDPFDPFSSQKGSESPLHDGVTEYRTSRNFPMFRNTSTSFIRAFYNKTNGRVCIDLIYPYG